MKKMKEKKKQKAKKIKIKKHKEKKKIKKTKSEKKTQKAPKKTETVAGSTYETARHEPGSRTVPVCPALYRFFPRKSKKLRYLAKKLIN